MKRACWLLLGLFCLTALPAAAQQKIGYIDSERILNQTPEYATVGQKLDRLAAQWEAELEDKQEALEELRAEYQARELIYTDEERRQKQEEIARAEREIEQLRREYFGPEGRLYAEQDRLMRPLQERVLAAVEEVAQADGYDYVFDKSGDFLFLFARAEHDLTRAVLQELGIDVESE